MKPSLTDVLMNAAGTLGTGVAPHLLDKPYALGHIGAIGVLLVFVAQESERAVENAVADNAEMRAIFATATKAALPEGLKQAVAKAAGGQDASLNLRVLEASNAALKAVLVALHEAADDSIAPWARELQHAIWAHLKASMERRALALPAS
jgi:hypothetical protein